MYILTVFIILVLTVIKTGKFLKKKMQNINAQCQGKVKSQGQKKYC